ncbi:MAG: hypothetical protein ACHQU0_03515 [Candidatus Paceibacteria bacterium]
MKTFNTDWNSLDDVSRLFNRAKSRFFELKRIADGEPSRKERGRRLFAACSAIWNTDISSVYASLRLDLSPVYCVYAHLDPCRKVVIERDGVTTFAATLGMEFWPFYIGKGTGDRWQQFNRNETHRKVRERISLLSRAPVAMKIADGLTESEALQRESKLIDIFGLITSGGKLCNLDEGLCPEQRREFYLSAYRLLRPLNRVTHVNGA